MSPGKQAQFLVFVDAKISAGCDVADPHRMQPVDETARPFGASQFQSPEGSGLQHNIATFVHNNAANKINRALKTKTISSVLFKRTFVQFVPTKTTE